MTKRPSRQSRREKRDAIARVARSGRLETHIDGIIDVLAQKVEAEVAEAQRMMADLEAEVALFEMQHTERVIH